MTATSFIPPGFLKLRDAVDRVGQHLYGVAWTQSEIQQLGGSPPEKPSDRLEAAVDQLRGFLALGRIKAIAIAQNGVVFPVESGVWLSDSGRQLFDTGLLPVGNLLEHLQARNNRSHRRQILVDENQLRALLTEEVERYGTTTRQATIGAEKKCQNWLFREMKAGPPKEKKTWYRSEANKRFSVGTKAFNRAWANAIADSGNEAWTKPGPKSKPRTDTPINS